MANVLNSSKVTRVSLLFKVNILVFLFVIKSFVRMNKQTLFYHIVNCLKKAKRQQNTDDDETKPPLNLEPPPPFQRKKDGGAARSWYSEIVLLVVVIEVLC